MSIRGFLPVLVAGIALTFVGCSEPGAAGEDGEDGAAAVGANADGADAAEGSASNNDAARAGDSTASSRGAPEIPGLPGRIALSPENTTVTFVGTKDDGSHDGGFRELDGSLVVAGDSVRTISVTAATESLWADNPKLEGHLKSRDFFEVEAHPELSFVSTRIAPTDGGEGTHTVTGDLTMLGQTHSVNTPATIEVSSDTVNLTSDFTIDRTQWGMNYQPERVHKDVRISVKIGAPR